MPEYRVPIYARILSHTLPYETVKTLLAKVDFEGHSSGYSREQAIAPPIAPIHQALSIRKGSRVLGFAGSTGHWLNALAHTATVHYTDISPVMLREASGVFGEKIKSFSQVDALNLPVEGEEYDYLFSFEPVTLKERLLLIVLKALAYTKGIRLVNTYINRKIIREYDKSAGYYAARIKTTVDSRTRYSEHNIFRADADEDARRKARFDLAVIELLQRRKNIEAGEIIGELAKNGTAANIRTLRASLKRIHGIGEDINKDYSQKTSKRKFTEMRAVIFPNE